MRLSQNPPKLLSLFLLALSHTTPANAGPYPKDDLHDIGYSFLQARGCDSYCGADNQYCCSAGQACYTSAANNVAYCGAAAAATEAVVAQGGYQVYTITYTETDLILRTSTYTSSWQAVSTTTTSIYIAGAPAPTNVAPVCTSSLGQSSCGNICCASDQYCAALNTCTAVGGWVPTSTPTSTYSAPVRPTSGSGGVSTATSVTSTTVGFLPAATASGSAFPTVSTSNSGLSPGAIAGIVIGVIAGIIILLLICFCCILKAGFDGLLALLGIRSKKRRSTERVETVERYSRHGSGTASRRDTHTGWFGAGRPARVDNTRKKKSSGFGGLGAVGAGLIGLAAILGLKRKHDAKEKPPRSEIGSSYYTDSYTGTSASSASSDRRTRESRRHN